MRAHLYTTVYRYIRPLPPLPPPQRIAARRKDLGLHPSIHREATLHRSQAVRSPVRARRRYWKRGGGEAWRGRPPPPPVYYIPPGEGGHRGDV